MRYIHLKEDDSIMFDRYLEALATYRAQLPEGVAQFAGDEERFMLSHPKSLHDARLERATVKETPGNEQGPSVVEVELLLAGQEGDRLIRLRYDGVSRYEIRGKQERFCWHDTFHGDIYTHEVRVGDAGSVVHEILFKSDFIIEIECVDFRVEDEIYPQNQC
jgi:hypothetical protein